MRLKVKHMLNASPETSLGMPRDVDYVEHVYVITLENKTPEI